MIQSTNAIGKSGRDTIAIDGGEPIRTSAVPPWPFYGPDEVAAVASVLETGKVNQWTGSTIAEFQAEFAEFINVRHAVAVANGTVAIELALRGLGIKPGDQVIVPARTFVATASCVLLVGATPVFADIDLDTQLLTAETILPQITNRTRAVIPVHLSGRPSAMPEIMALAKQYGFFVIEDCAQSLGAEIDGRPLGSFGHAAAFSFCQDKIVSTGGEGGMIVTDDEEVWNAAWSFRDHGKTMDKAFGPSQEPGYRWMHDSVGSNARMTAMQAAIGRVQLKKLKGWIVRRNQIADRLAQALSVYPCVLLPPVPPSHVHARYRLELRLDTGRLRQGWTRDRIMLALGKEGVPAFVGTCPEVYREGVFANRQNYPRLPNAQVLAETSLVLLTHPTIDEDYLTDCEAAIDKVFSAACL